MGTGGHLFPPSPFAWPGSILGVALATILHEAAGDRRGERDRSPRRSGVASRCPADRRTLTAPEGTGGDEDRTAARHENPCQHSTGDAAGAVRTRVGELPSGAGRCRAGRSVSAARVGGGCGAGGSGTAASVKSWPVTASPRL